MFNFFVNCLYSGLKNIRFSYLQVFHNNLVIYSIFIIVFSYLLETFHKEKIISKFIFKCDTGGIKF